MRINERPLSDFGLEPVSSDERIAYPGGSLLISEIPDTTGAQLTDIEHDRPRRVTIRARIRGDDEGDFFQNRDSLADLLAGALEVRFSDLDELAERILYCQLEALNAPAGESPEWRGSNRPVEIVLVATDPFFYDRVAMLSGGEAGLLLGTAPAGELATLVGGPLTTALELRLKDWRGEEVNRIKWTGSLAAGDWLEIRHSRSMVRKFDGTPPDTVTTYANAIADLDTTVANFGFFTLSPELGDRATSRWPVIDVISGDHVSLWHTYRRGWR